MVVLFLLFALNHAENRNGAIETGGSPANTLLVTNLKQKQDCFAWEYCLFDDTVLHQTTLLVLLLF